MFEVFERYKTPIDMISTSEVAVSVTIDDNKNLHPIMEELKVLVQLKLIPTNPSSVLWATCSPKRRCTKRGLSIAGISAYPHGIVRW